MTKRFLSIGVAGVLALGAAGCTSFESGSTITSPSAPSDTPGAGPQTGTNGGSQTAAIVGLWTTSSDFPVPTSKSCGDFQWQIASQSTTDVSGSFTAECDGGITISATASGVLQTPTTVAISITGIGVISGYPVCSFSLSGIGTIVDNNTLTIPYTGTTCVGPVQGTETLRRHVDPPPPPPPAEEPPPPEPSTPSQPVENPHHIPPGPMTFDQVSDIVFATSREYPWLTRVYGNDDEALNAAEELLLRTIWHLQRAGFNAARQKNPSGAISKDKLSIVVDGAWWAFDTMSLGYAGRATTVHFLTIPGVNPVPDGGIPD